MHAEAGQALLPDRVEEAAAAFATIADGARATLDDLRRMLGVLRRSEGPAPLGPQPGLADLDELVEQVRGTGVHAALVRTGDDGPALPDALDLAVYRVVQEALTNVIKHAHASSVRITVRREPDVVEVEVLDDGVGLTASDSSEGQGMIGMRERRRDVRRDAQPSGAVESEGVPGAGHLPRAGCRGMTIRVLVVDDQELVRTGFRLILDAQDDVEVVGEAVDGADAVRSVARTSPDVVLMDVRMPVMDGIEATRRICADEDGGDTKVVMLTTFDLDEYVFEALRAGASGFLLKDVGRDDLLRAVRVVAGGDALLAPSVTRRLIEDYARRPAVLDRAGEAAAVETLTGREAETLTLMAEGLSNAEIAGRMYVSEATAKTHVAHVLMKLHLRDRVQAVVFAYETGIVRPA